MTDDLPDAIKLVTCVSPPSTCHTRAADRKTQRSGGMAK